VTHDQDLVADIVAQLRRGGPLRDPRLPPVDKEDPRRFLEAMRDRPEQFADPRTLPAHARFEVQRSIDRILFLQTYKPPRQLPAASDFRRAAAMLRRIAITAEQIKRAGAVEPDGHRHGFEAVWQEPPERGWSPLEYRCAVEAFDLMTFFSAKPPVSTARDTKKSIGPRKRKRFTSFQVIAALLYQATACCKPSHNLEHACDRVLRERIYFRVGLKPPKRRPDPTS
jgi:hypothetical protein